MPKVTKKELVDAFIDIVVEDLAEWASKAVKIIKATDNKAVANISEIHSLQLRKINTSIEDLKNRIKDLFETYKELEKKYEMNPLSIEYNMYYGNEIAPALVDIVNDINVVFRHYSTILSLAHKQGTNVNEYITPTNQKSIEFFKNLNDSRLIGVLEEGHLSGL